MPNGVILYNIKEQKVTFHNKMVEEQLQSDTINFIEADLKRVREKTEDKEEERPMTFKQVMEQVIGNRESSKSLD